MDATSNEGALQQCGTMFEQCGAVFWHVTFETGKKIVTINTLGNYGSLGDKVVSCMRKTVFNY
jgi:hypothetical protein